MTHLASLFGNGLHLNRIFDRSSPANRDDCFLPYVRLRELFLAQGIELNTADVNGGASVLFELHQDVQQAGGSAPAYLLLFETPVLYPANGRPENLEKYTRIFTWNDSLVDGNRFVKLNNPNPLRVPEVDGYAGRDCFSCIIAGNKAMPSADPRELYSERVRTIRWFEQHAPADFALYGTDWNLPAAKPGLVGKLEKRFWRLSSRFLARTPFPSYRGKVERKLDVLGKTRFSFCYENVRDIPGYITEKLFDSFFAGCVPVYWGANNIADHVPAGCYIDRRQFADTAEVYRFIKNMDEPTYRGYQQRIRDFLLSDAAQAFGAEKFATTIVSTITDDLAKKS